MRPALKPTVTVVHQLPGRVRARLSHAPDDPERIRTSILEHVGTESVEYTPLSRSLLVRFDPHRVTQEEIVLRIALCLSLDRGTVPVRLLARPERTALGGGAIYSGLGLALSLALRWWAGQPKNPSRLDWAAAVGTACAVVEHAVKEMDEKGYFDPEVLSLAYLVTSFLRGNFVKASVVTWLTTFGRHLLDVQPGGVQVRPMAVSADGENREPRYELVIGPDTDAPDRVRLLGALQGLLKFAVTGGGAHGYRNLLDELRDVSKVHGEVLEGFGRLRHGIPMRFD